MKSTKTDEEMIQGNERVVTVSYAWAGCAALATLGAGGLLGWAWADIHPASAKAIAGWVQLGSGVFFLWAVLGLAGWQIQTLGGTSRPERRNIRLYKALNALGMLLLFGS